METSSRRTLRGPRGSSQANSWSSLRSVPGRARHCSCTTAAPQPPPARHRRRGRDASGSARSVPRGADHPVRAVFNELYGLRRDGLGEARPPGARVVLRAAIEEQVAAGGAVVEAGFVGVHVLTGERTLGRSLTQDGILLCREPLPPLLVGEGHLV